MPVSDDLYTASIVLVDPTTGRLISHGVHVSRDASGLWRITFVDQPEAGIGAESLDVVAHLFRPMIEIGRRRAANRTTP